MVQKQKKKKIKYFDLLKEKMIFSCIIPWGITIWKRDPYLNILTEWWCHRCIRKCHWKNLDVGGESLLLKCIFSQRQWFCPQQFSLKYEQRLQKQNQKVLVFKNETSSAEH